MFDTRIETKARAFLLMYGAQGEEVSRSVVPSIIFPEDLRELTASIFVTLEKAFLREPSTFYLETFFHWEVKPEHLDGRYLAEGSWQKVRDLLDRIFFNTLRLRVSLGSERSTGKRGHTLSWDARDDKLLRELFSPASSIELRDCWEMMNAQSKDDASFVTFQVEGKSFRVPGNLFTKIPNFERPETKETLCSFFKRSRLNSFVLFIGYLCKDKILCDERNAAQFVELRRIATILSLSELQYRCTLHLVLSLNKENSLGIAVCARDMGDKKLKSACLSINLMPDIKRNPTIWSLFSRIFHW